MTLGMGEHRIKERLRSTMWTLLTDHNLEATSTQQYLGQSARILTSEHAPRRAKPEQEDEFSRASCVAYIVDVATPSREAAEKHGKRKFDIDIDEV